MVILLPVLRRSVLTLPPTLFETHTFIPSSPWKWRNYYLVYSPINKDDREGKKDKRRVEETRKGEGRSLFTQDTLLKWSGGSLRGQTLGASVYRHSQLGGRPTPRRPQSLSQGRGKVVRQFWVS